jgi:hypothetical protein
MYSTIWVQLYWQFLRHWDGPVGENVDYHRQKKSVEKYFIARGYK